MGRYRFSLAGCERVVRALPYRAELWAKDGLGMRATATSFVGLFRSIISIGGDSSVVMNALLCAVGARSLRAYVQSVRVGAHQGAQAELQEVKV